MRASGILSRYIFKELISPFLLALLVFSSVAMMAKLIDLMDMVINKGLAPGQVLLLVLYVMPSLLVYTVPMSVVLAVLIALGRLSADAEIIALKASGISLYQMLPPFAVVCLTGFVITALCSISLEPLGRRAFRGHVENVGAQHIAAGLQGGVFNNTLDGLVIYVQEFDPDSLQVKNIMISDRRDLSQPVLIVAARGIILSDQNNLQLLFKLYDGSIHRTDAAQKYEYAVFTTYQMRLLLADIAGAENKPLKQKELGLHSLFEQARDRKSQGLAFLRETTEIHKRFALPFACLVFGLLGLSLGVYLRRGGRAGGFMLSLVIVTLYYLLLSLGEEISKGGFVHPAIGMWMPNGVMGALAIYLFYTTVHEKPYPFGRVYTKKIAPFFTEAATRLINRIDRIKK
ncbi:MAG: LPS export ABC transporter permease LptF [Deltaproteobacteria bacterium]|nr:LPS export ABC transporter permease LptF [Deltaproteobacteria bacterium]